MSQGIDRMDEVVTYFVHTYIFYVTHNHMCLCVFIYFMSCILYCDVSGRLVFSLLINWLIDW